MGNPFIKYHLENGINDNNLNWKKLTQYCFITYREKDHDFLMEIRNGKYLNKDRQPVPEFFDIVDEYEHRLEYAKKNTDLPDNPDYKAIKEFTVSVNERIIKDEV